MDYYKIEKDIMNEYLCKISTVASYYTENIPLKKIDLAIKKINMQIEKSDIIGFLDTSITNTGKTGYIFTRDKMYWLDIFEKSNQLSYKDIKSFEIKKEHKKDCNRELLIKTFSGNTYLLTSTLINKISLKEFLNIMMSEDFQYTKENISYDTHNQFGAIAGGLSIGAYGNVNKQFEEEKFHAKQGHGFSAEKANNLYDKLTGHNAKILGDDNAKNGADRIVDGVYIQSKYCASGSRCINECFNEHGSGSFRYMIDGKPMQIEVPSDKYNDALQAMRNKILKGQVDGINDPEEAINIVRKGHFTYEQAKNIAKAGTVESLTYDAVNGVIIASSAFGVTAIITFATSIWNGESYDNSLKLATYSGLKVGGTAFITSVISSQLSKAGLNSLLVNSSEAIVKVMGSKASAILINSFRVGSKPIYGAAAMKSASKLLRGNAITAGVSFIVLSSVDISNIFRGRISGKQLFKNLTNTASTVGGGTGGWLAGATLGSAVLPVVGTVVGGVIGSVAVGSLAGKASNSIVGKFIEDDANEMIKIIENVFNDMSTNYLLNKDDAEKVVITLQKELSVKILKDMFSSNDRFKFARDILEPIIENELLTREIVSIISAEDMTNSLKLVLEEISDNFSDELP